MKNRLKNSLKNSLIKEQTDEGLTDGGQTD